MEPLYIAVVAVTALLSGFAVAWLLRGRELAAAQAERSALAERIERSEEMRNAALRDYAVAKERADEAEGLRGALSGMTEERDRLRGENLTLKAEYEARMDAFAAQIRHLQEMRQEMSSQFSEIGGKLLGEAQRAFLERADQRFAQASEKNETHIKSLLAPVETTLKRYEEGLGRVEKERVDSYAALREQVEQLRVGAQETRAETARLVNALRSSPKARGRWGEQQLRNVLEMAGLSEHADFRTEVSVDTADGRLRPDVIVRLPGGRQLIIDAKCSLNAYLEAAEAEDEVVRTGHLRAHAAALRNHAQQLGGKEYQRHFEGTTDYVVMFIPGEHFLTAALEQDGGLWEWAFERRVLLATPTNLVAIARTVASVWRQEKMAEDAARIGQLGKEMYERLNVAAGHLRKLGNGLNSAVGNYNSFVASFENRVLVTGRKFRDLNVETGGKELEQAEGVDLLARLPNAGEGTAEPEPEPEREGQEA